MYVFEQAWKEKGSKQEQESIFILVIAYMQ